jgi:replicative DNA helicase
MSIKDPPHSKESEMMVLGCMLSNQYALSTASAGLDLSDFYFEEHRCIFQALKKLYQDSKPSEIHLTAEELKKNNQLEKVGGISYLTQLAQFAGTSSNVHEYVEIVRIKSFNRKASYLLEEGKKEFLTDPLDPIDIVGKYYQKLIELGKRYSPIEKASIGEILSGAKSRIDPIPLIERIEERQAYYKKYNKPFMVGIPTGFTELDRKVTILEETNLVVVAARPSMGKTAFAINIANHLSVDRKKPVAIFSLEMGADQLAERFLSLRTGIAGERIKRGILTDRDLLKIKKEEEIVSSAKLFIHDCNISYISQIISKARRLKEEEDISLFIIDYLQLLNNGGKTESRQYEVADISRKLKLLAMEIKTPFICISQLSRKVEERKDRRPLLSDLRDSGQIEQDSDVVLFIQRNEYYNPNDQPGISELIIAKNRHGDIIPSTFLHFNGQCGKFFSISNEQKIKTMDEARKDDLYCASHPLLR